MTYGFIFEKPATSRALSKKNGKTFRSPKDFIGIRRPVRSDTKPITGGGRDI